MNDYRSVKLISKYVHLTKRTPQIRTHGGVFHFIRHHLVALKMAGVALVKHFQFRLTKATTSNVLQTTPPTRPTPFSL